MSSTVLCIEKIRKNLANKSLHNLDIFMYESTDSTNTRAKLYAETEPFCKKAVFIAKEQTAGRGRLGKTFDSKAGGGIYISFLFGEKAAVSPSLITAKAAVKVCRVLEEVSTAECQIKWVNDIYSDGKKLSGILCEGKSNSYGELLYHIVGIGINLYSRHFPEEIKDIAVSIEDITGESVDINLLAAKLIDSFFDSDAELPFMDEYRRRSNLIGKNVTVKKLSGEVFESEAIEISDDASLVVKKSDGTRESLISAEVSIRLE